MKQTGIALLGVALCVPAHADWSDALAHAALADHFTRYYCSVKRPHLNATIAAAFDSSKLKAVSVSCEGLTCDSPEHTDGMKRLLVRAEEQTEAQLTKICASYSVTLREIEERFSDELASGSGQ